MLDPRNKAFQCAGQLPLPLPAESLYTACSTGAGLAALRAETLLNAKSTTVARTRINRQIVGVHALVTQTPRAGIHHLEIVGGRHAGIAIAACHPKPPLSRLIPAFQLDVVDRPIGE